MSTEMPYHFAHLLQVSKISLKPDFLHISNDFMHVYSPRAGANNTFGTEFDVNRKALSLCNFVASFIKVSLKSDFIQQQTIST